MSASSRKVQLTEDEIHFAFLMSQNDTLKGLHEKLVTALIGETYDPFVWVVVKALGNKISKGK